MCPRYDISARFATIFFSQLKRALTNRSQKIRNVLYLRTIFVRWNTFIIGIETNVYGTKVNLSLLVRR